MDGDDRADDGPAAPPRAPSFRPPVTPPRVRPVPPRPVVEPSTRPPRLVRPPRPPRSVWPPVLSGLVVALVASVVLAATAVARHADTHVPRLTTQASARSPVPAVVETPGVIAFRTTDGEGRLALLDRSWTGARGSGSATGLRVEVALVCTGGKVHVAPARFSVFDAAGGLHEARSAAAGADELPETTLGTGDEVRGTVAFDLPVGATTGSGVTLVLADEVGAVTALRVPR